MERQFLETEINIGKSASRSQLFATVGTTARKIFAALDSR